MTPWTWGLLAVGLSSWLLMVPATRIGVRRGTAPRDRDLHDRPTSRLGGVALAIPALIAIGFAGAGDAPIGGWLVLAALLLALLVGAIDDLKDVATASKLAGEAAVGVMLGLAAWLAGGAGWVVLLALLLPVLFQNAFNFVDGSDGLLGTVSLIAFTAGAMLAGSVASPEGEAVAATAAICAAAVAGFLPWNLPRARVFMGDGGSLFLGAAFTWCLVQSFSSSPDLGWAWVALASPILGDVTVCLSRRILRGAEWWRAHREHAYQRAVVRSGSHWSPLWWAVGLQLLVAVPAAWLALKHGWSAATSGLGACLLVAWVGGSGRPAVSKMPVQRSS